MARRLPSLTLKPKERRVVLIGAVIVGLLLGYVYGAEPLLRARGETRAQLEAARLRVQRYERLLAQRDRLAQESKELDQKSDALRARLLEGPTPSLAAAQLQETVKDEARRADLDVERMAVERPTANGRVSEVAIRVVLRGGMRQLSAFIARTERHQRALSIPELTIQVQDPKNPRELIIDLVVAGYLVLPEETPATRRSATTPTATEERAR